MNRVRFGTIFREMSGAATCIFIGGRNSDSGYSQAETRMRTDHVEVMAMIVRIWRTRVDPSRTSEYKAFAGRP